jgi:uncharacterized protein (TIGR03437 family)
MRTLSLGLLFVVALAAPLEAQTDRIVGSIDSRSVVALKGNSNPRARVSLDRGRLDAWRRIGGITLNFQGTAEQRAELAQLLKDQQNPSSSRYHQWLSPAEVADRFGLSRADFAKVVAWAESQGLEIDYAAATRTFLRCSGTAAQTERAFHTELHRYEVDGEIHFANSMDPSLPAAIAPLVSVVLGLDDFHPHAPGVRSHAPKLAPMYTQGTMHFLVPGDLWVIYNAAPLLNAGYDGTDQRLVVVGQSNGSLADVRTFRKDVGLPANDPQIVAVPGTPTTISEAGQEEMSIDLELAGGMAPNATILYVFAQGALAAVQYAIDQKLAPVISASYGECEAMATASSLTAGFVQGLAQQGNAMGITWVASSGDQGAAACDVGPTISTAVKGLAVSIPASVPEVTGVGGTTFSDPGGGFWSSANAPNGTSALKYIPESAWNDFAIAGVLSASGGGASTFYPKPSWQTGPGVPNDGARDVPDVSFAASANHDGYALIIDGVTQIEGGTSTSTPVFAGMLALLNHYLTGTGAQRQPGLGNINPTLYRIARSGSNVFHDVTSGDNIVPCALATPNCTSGELGWSAGAGYDLATGLGSFDLANLAHQWASSPSAALTLTAAPATVMPNPSLSCPYFQNLILQETNGYSVTLTHFSNTQGADFTPNLTNTFGSLRLPAYGALMGIVCWGTGQLANPTAPSSETIEVDGKDSLGNSVSARTSIAFETPTPSAGPLIVSPPTLSLASTSSQAASASSQAASGTIALTVPSGQAWSILASPSGPSTAWLKVTPQSGTGPAQIAISATGTGLPNGAYYADLVVQSANTSPAAFIASVVFVLGGSPGVKISAVANTASGQPTAAPGMYLSVYGAGLAPAGTNMGSSTSPLPMSLAGVSATINGIPSAMEYASPGQVNLLIPFEVAAGTAELSLNNNGQIAAFTFPVSLAAPGIFVDPDGSSLVAGAESAVRGGEIAFYITGQGDVSPMIASNTAVTPPAVTPVPQGKLSVTIGGQPAQILYGALTYYFEGLMQINVTVPTTISTGVQPVVVRVGDSLSAAAKINITK